MIRLLTFALPALFVLAGIPLRLGWVPPNRWYGYRTALTFRNPDVWYSVNRELGVAMLVAGVLGLAVGVALLRLAPTWRGETRLLVSIISQSLLLFAALLIVVLRTQRI